MDYVHNPNPHRPVNPKPPRFKYTAVPIDTIITDEEQFYEQESRYVAGGIQRLGMRAGESNHKPQADIIWRYQLFCWTTGREPIPIDRSKSARGDWFWCLADQRGDSVCLVFPEQIILNPRYFPEADA
ncbi:MAG: hypothetical protein ABJN62_18685 [Halioglobus sp.]